MADDVHSAVEFVAETIAEYQAHGSWAIIGDDLKEAHRRKATAIIRALVRRGYVEAE